MTNPRKQLFTFRIEGEHKRRLFNLAAKLGKRPGELVRNLVIERLKAK
jgi:hypothetical protein